MCHYKAIAAANSAAISADSAWLGQCFGHEQAMCMHTCLPLIKKESWSGTLELVRPFEWQIERNELKLGKKSKPEVSWQPSA